MGIMAEFSSYVKILTKTVVMVARLAGNIIFLLQGIRVILQNIIRPLALTGDFGLAFSMALFPFRPIIVISAFHLMSRDCRPKIKTFRKNKLIHKHIITT